MLARWNNPARSPAVVERVVGDGRVLLWTTTADRAGNDWPIEPSFVLAVREAVRGAARPTPLGNTVTAGERMRRVVHSSQPDLQRPARPRPAAASRSRSRPSRWTRSPAIAARRSRSRSPTPGSRGCTASPGTKARWAPSKISTRPTPTRAKARSSGSRRAELKSLLEPLEVEIAEPATTRPNLFSATGREIWRDLAVALLVLLIVESIFATWVGRSR